jgi:Na+/pantothenate symporter
VEPAGFAASATLTFLVYTVGVFILAWLSHRILAQREFLSEYYLGSRGLGVVALTLTLGATAASAGSFAGFPALIYAHGWVLSLWIAGYMMVPLCAMGLFGKRLNQMARASGCITLPDVLRERYGSPALALSASLLMVLMLSFYLIPQFKLAALILRQLLGGMEWFSASAVLLSRSSSQWGLDAEYLLCLLIFAVMVVAYTTLGGFRAVVWTDVLQGIIMVGGVVVLLGLALAYVGGLPSATKRLAEMTTPRLGTALFRHANGQPAAIRIPVDSWFTIPSEPTPRLFRLNESAVIPAGDLESSAAKVVEITTPEEIDAILASQRQSIGLPGGVSAEIVELRDYAFGAGKRGVYVTAPGPAPPGGVEDDAGASTGFLSIGLAISFFFYWSLSGAGQPGTMVRLMAFDNARTLTRSIAALTVYFGIIYFPLVIIFCCARLIVPGIDQTPDRIMPAVAFELSSWAGAPWLAGLLLAVPFAAAMSTVDSFMLMISSSLVRDVYQRQINPAASPRTVKVLSYACMILIGAVVTIGAMNPPKFLQYLIVFAGGGLSVSFLVPLAMALYWPRSNLAGVMAAMFGGIGFYLSLYIGGFIAYGRATPLFLLQLDPMVWGAVASALFGLGVTLATKPPPAQLVDRFFHQSSDS